MLFIESKFILFLILSKFSSGISKSDIIFFISSQILLNLLKSKLISKFFKISLFSQIIDNVSFIESKFSQSIASFKSKILYLTKFSLFSSDALDIRDFLILFFASNNSQSLADIKFNFWYWDNNSL